jgi:hypothetical protein
LFLSIVSFILTNTGKRDGGRRRRLDSEEGGAAEPGPVGQRVRRDLVEDPDELRSRCFPQDAHQRRRRLAENSDELREDPDKRLASLLRRHTGTPKKLKSVINDGE